MEITKLYKKYRRFELCLENLSFEKCGLVGLLGDNGAGKTTMMNILAGKIDANTLEVSAFGGDKIYGEPRTYQNSFYISSATKYYGKLSAIIGDFEQLFNGFDAEKCKQITSQFNLDLKTRYSKLSQGMQAQFKLALVIALPVKVLYLDEITNGLDTSSRAIILEQIKAISSEKLVFLSTHILDKNTTFFDRVIFLDKGKIVFDVSKNQTLIKVNGEYKVVDVKDANDSESYDVVEVYKSFSENKARSVLYE